MKIINCLSIVLMVLIGFSACKSDNNVEIPELTDNEVAKIIENDYFSSLSVNLESAFRLTSSDVNCSVNYDSVVSVLVQSDNFGSYSATNTWSWTFNCLGLLPTSVTANLQGNSNFDSDSLDLNRTQTGNFIITNLIGDENFIANGTVTAQGSGQLLTSQGLRNVDSESTIVYTNLSIDRISRQPVSGTVTITVQGTIDSSVT